MSYTHTCPICGDVLGMHVVHLHGRSFYFAGRPPLHTSDVQELVAWQQQCRELLRRSAAHAICPVCGQDTGDGHAHSSSEYAMAAALPPLRQEAALTTRAAQEALTPALTPDGPQSGRQRTSDGKPGVSDLTGGARRFTLTVYAVLLAAVGWSFGHSGGLLPALLIAFYLLLFAQLVGYRPKRWVKARLAGAFLLLALVCGRARRVCARARGEG